jgi:hypothetical protein
VRHFVRPIASNYNPSDSHRNTSRAVQYFENRNSYGQHEGFVRFAELGDLFCSNKKFPHLSGSIQCVRSCLFTIARRCARAIRLPHPHLHSRGDSWLQSVTWRLELSGKARNHAANSREVKSTKRIGEPGEQIAQAKQNEPGRRSRHVVSHFEAHARLLVQTLSMCRCKTDY